MTLSKGSIALLLGCFVLAGCQKPANYPLALPEETIGLSMRGDMTAERITDKHVLALRTYERISEGKGAENFAEVSGAKCTLTSTQFSARFTTPTNVALPEVAGKPEPLTLACARGDKKGARAFAPNIEYTSTQITGSGSAGAFAAGLLITVVANAASASAAKKRDEWRFVRSDNTEVNLNLGEPETTPEN